VSRKLEMHEGVGTPEGWEKLIIKRGNSTIALWYASAAGANVLKMSGRGGLGGMARKGDLRSLPKNRNERPSKNKNQTSPSDVNNLTGQGSNRVNTCWLVRKGTTLSKEIGGSRCLTGSRCQRGE